MQVVFVFTVSFWVVVYNCWQNGYTSDNYNKANVISYLLLKKYSIIFWDYFIYSEAIYFINVFRRLSVRSTRNRKPPDMRVGIKRLYQKTHLSVTI